MGWRALWTHAQPLAAEERGRSLSKTGGGMRSSVVIFVIVGLVTLSGCGADASKRDVEQVVERFETALADRDGAAACAQLTAPTSAALAKQEQQPCPRAVLGLGLRGAAAVTRTDVYLTSGFAEIGSEAVFLDQTSRGWRISAAGCTPTRPDMPYDCELES
jgi:hypothetical protein